MYTYIAHGSKCGTFPAQETKKKEEEEKYYF